MHSDVLTAFAFEHLASAEATSPAFLTEIGKYLEVNRFKFACPAVSVGVGTAHASGHRNVAVYMHFCG